MQLMWSELTMGDTISARTCLCFKERTGHIKIISCIIAGDYLIIVADYDNGISLDNVMFVFHRYICAHDRLYGPRID